MTDRPNLPGLCGHVFACTCPIRPDERRRFLVRVENTFEVEAQDEDHARDQAMDDMAWGRASMSNAQVLDVEPLGSDEIRAPHDS